MNFAVLRGQSAIYCTAVAGRVCIWLALGIGVWVWEGAIALKPRFLVNFGFDQIDRDLALHVGFVRWLCLLVLNHLLPGHRYPLHWL